MSKYFVGPVYFSCPLSCENWQQLVTNLQYFLINNKAETISLPMRAIVLTRTVHHTRHWKWGINPPNQKSYNCHNHFSSTTVHRPIIIKMSEWKAITKNTYFKSVEQKRHIIETIQCTNEWKQKDARSFKESHSEIYFYTFSVIPSHWCAPDSYSLALKNRCFWDINDSMANAFLAALI